MGVVLVAAPGPATNIVHHALTRAFGDVPVVLERPVPRRRLLARRARRLGLATVAGQVLFGAVVVPALARRSRPRIAAILADHGLDASPLDGTVVPVASMNAPAAHDALRRLAPSVVVVSGTRILSPETLGCVEAPFVNLHAGITPQYRGVHGAWWALAEGRPELVGSTVHLLDPGIDTGPILGQVTFTVGPDDCFVTYPYLHVAAGLPVLLEHVAELAAGRPPRPRPPLSTAEPSRLRSHPTLGQYVAARRRGVA